MTKDKPQETTIPSDDNMGEFGMDSIKEVKYTPNKVKEVEGVGNAVNID